MYFNLGKIVADLFERICRCFFVIQLGFASSGLVFFYFSFHSNPSLYCDIKFDLPFSSSTEYAIISCFSYYHTCHKKHPQQDELGRDDWQPHYSCQFGRTIYTAAKWSNSGFKDWWHVKARGQLNADLQRVTKVNKSVIAEPRLFTESSENPVPWQTNSGNLKKLNHLFLLLSPVINSNVIT